MEVLDIDSLSLVGNVPKTPGVHGVALAPEAGRGFVSNGQASTVTIFDLKTLKPIADVPTGQKPDAIIYDPATSRVFAFNGGGNSVTAIDAATGKVAGTVNLSGGPEFAAADGNGYVFNNLEDESLVLKINSRELKVEQRWPTAPCSSPSSMAMDRANRRLFIGCRSKVMAVLDADSGKVITTLPIGDHVDATAFDPETKLIFNSNGEGTITVIEQDSPNEYEVVETVKTRAARQDYGTRPENAPAFSVDCRERTIRSAGRGKIERVPKSELPHDCKKHVPCENSRMAIRNGRGPRTHLLHQEVERGPDIDRRPAPGRERSLPFRGLRRHAFPRS